MKNDFLTRRAKRQVIEYEAKRWPRRIPYEMDPSFGDYKKIILEALKLWSSNSCLSFYESAEVTDRIKFVKDPKINCSFVGAPPHIVKEELFKQTIIKLTVDGRNTGDAVHEIGHALGMKHTHQHPDRDNHLEIYEDNVDLSGEDLLINFGKQHRGRTFGVPYDHGSVMAYSAFAGSKDKKRPIFTLKEPWHEHVPGGNRMSGAEVISSITKPAFTDLLILNLFYECADVCNEKRQLAGNKVQKCQNGGFPNPKNCSKCVCPTGFHGADCSRANNGHCGEEIDVHNVGKDGLVKFDRTLSTRTYAECHYHIKAPEGKVIQFKVTGVKSPDCWHVCPFGYAEIKARDDLRLTGMRFCCKKDMKYFTKFHESESNRIVVSLYAAAYGKTRLTMKYKIVDKKKTDSGTDSSLIRHGSNFSNVSRRGSKKEEKFDGKAPGKGGIKWKIWNRA